MSIFILFGMMSTRYSALKSGQENGPVDILVGQGLSTECDQQLRTIEIALEMNISGWWSGTVEFYDFPYIGNNHPD